MADLEPSQYPEAHQNDSRSNGTTRSPQVTASSHQMGLVHCAAGGNSSATSGPMTPAPGVGGTAATAVQSEQDAESTVPFTCHVCGLSEQCHYRGARPPFSRSVQLAEPGYVMRDPFSARGAGQLLLLGSDCVLCGRPVCQDTACSLFFTRRFCLPCASQHAAEFPPQLRDKLGA